MPLLDQADEHLTYSSVLPNQLGAIVVPNVLQAFRDLKMHNHLVHGTERMLDVHLEVSSRSSLAVSFCDICWHRLARPSHLRCELVSLMVRKPKCETMHRREQAHRPLKRLDVFIAANRLKR